MIGTGLSASRRCSSVPSVGLLAASGTLQHVEVLGPQDKGSQACFSPVFDLELDAKLGASSQLDRCFSHQHLNEQTAHPTSLLQQILTLCRCTSAVQAQLLQQLQRLRSAAYASSPASSTAEGLLSGGSGHSDDAAACVLAQEPHAHNSFAVALEEQRLDVEGMACELLALGYMVQVRDGAQQTERSKTPRSCLQNLRHRYIVCLGVREAADGEASYLPEPLVVEPRFREQFSIAHPTPDYEALLQSVPPCFVGPVSALEAAVKLMCEQMTATFKLQGLPVPPWRTRTALLSKWSPAQLADLAVKIAHLHHLSAALPTPSRAIVPCQSHDRLCNNDRPAAVHAQHAAVGSAPTSANGGAAAHTALGPGRAQPAPVYAPAYPMMQPGAQQQQQQHAQVARALPTGGAQDTGVEGGLRGAVQPQQLGQANWHADAGAALLPAQVAAQDQAVALDLQPTAAYEGVLALLAASQQGHGAVPGAAGLNFTRNASAEWKHQRSSNRKIKGLLAAALKKSVGGSRSNLLIPGLAAAEQCASQSGGKACGHSLDAGEVQQQAAGPAAALVGPGGDALIRRTHFRAACDEPWRRITTVRLGAYAPQQQQQQQQQQQPVPHQPAPVQP